jgi:hypothetical protein
MITGTNIDRAIRVFLAFGLWANAAAYSTHLLTPSSAQAQNGTSPAACVLRNAAKIQNVAAIEGSSPFRWLRQVCNSKPDLQ